MLTLPTPHHKQLLRQSSPLPGHLAPRLIQPDLENGLAQLPLPSHRLSVAHDAHLDLIGEAWAHLHQVEPAIAAYAQRHIRFVFWMELRREYWGEDERITSASFPNWPGCVFISNKALVHIPPNTLFSAPSTWALAENLYHEAIHQEINQSILRGEILSDDFDARTAPKVHITWRKHQENRNQFWELDRCYHAAGVYAGLLNWRRQLLATAGAEDLDLERVTHAAQEGQKSFEFLIERLSQSENARYFTATGQQNIHAFAKGVHV
ncbi:MAG: hypothetical protein AB7N80_06770 [Bdellovibrionales bacterium]